MLLGCNFTDDQDFMVDGGLSAAYVTAVGEPPQGPKNFIS